jgi:RimJ/RimL family protein N-acetyltransferase
LASLYAGLSTDDLHLRFFSVYKPSRTFLEHLANAAAEGGYGLVAVVGDPDGRIVAEADYFLLPNGDGEMAIIVAPDWRGWLGPYLLDALIDAAAARGVPNLEAEVLVENRQMVALIRHRGYASLDGTDFMTLRVSIGTAATAPTWPGPHDRPRVLAEVGGGRWTREQALRQAGLQVIVCPGPQAGRAAHCPAVEGKPCPLVQGADVVVCSLAPGDERADQVRAAHASVRPGGPILREGPDALPTELTLDPSTTDDALLGLLRRILGDTRPPSKPVGHISLPR